MPTESTMLPISHRPDDDILAQKYSCKSQQQSACLEPIGSESVQRGFAAVSCITRLPSAVTAPLQAIPVGLHSA